MSFYPRSATVRAKTDCRDARDAAQCARRYAEEQDLPRPSSNANYRSRALGTHLRSVPIFSPRSTRISSTCCATASNWFASPPARSSAEEGAAADAFYLVRIGFVKVSQDHRGEELVLAYLPRGGYFGEMGLLARERPDGRKAQRHLHRTRSRRAGPISGRRFSPDAGALSPRYAAVSYKSHAKRARQKTSRSSAALSRQCPARQLPRPGADGSAEPAGPRPGEMHSLRPVRARLRRRPRRRHPSAARWPALRQLISSPPPAASAAIRSAWSAARSAPSAAATRSKSSSRTGASAAACAPPTARTATSTCRVRCLRQCHRAPVRAADNDSGNEHKVRKATSCDLCHDLPEPSCVYACPHDAAHRVKPEEFFFLKAQSAGLHQEALRRRPMRIDRTHRPWLIGTILGLLLVALIPLCAALLASPAAALRWV